MGKSTHSMHLLPSSIESQPKKVVFVAVVVVVVVFVVVVIIIVGYRNLALKFGPNRVIHS